MLIVSYWSKIFYLILKLEDKSKCLPECGQKSLNVISSRSCKTLILNSTFAENYNKPFHLLWKFDGTSGSPFECGTQSTNRVSSHSCKTLILSFTFADNYYKPFYLLCKFDGTWGACLSEAPKVLRGWAVAVVKPDWINFVHFLFLGFWHQSGHSRWSQSIVSGPMIHCPRKSYWRGRLSTVDPLEKVSCFVKKCK